jgi:hypothetical protein
MGDGISNVLQGAQIVVGLEKNKHRSKRKHKGTGGVGKQAVLLACRAQGSRSLPSRSQGHIEELGPDP